MTLAALGGSTPMIAAAAMRGSKCISCCEVLSADARGANGRSVTMDTGEIIRLLADGWESVRLVQRPWTRTAEWLAVALLYVLLVVFVVSPRPDLAARIFDLRFVVEQVPAVAPGIAAAVAAFTTVIQGYSRKFLTLPFLSLSIWFGTLGHAYVQDNLRDWIRPGSSALALHPDWYCFPAIVLVGLVPAIAMTMMLRRSAALRLHLTAALGGLAAAALGSFCVRLFCPQDASSILLVWQFGAVCVPSALACCAGRHVLNRTPGALWA